MFHTVVAGCQWWMWLDMGRMERRMLDLHRQYPELAVPHALGRDNVWYGAMMVSVLAVITWALAWRDAQP